MTSDMAIAGWGDPARRTGLPSHAVDWLRREIGSTSPARPADITVAASRLADGDRVALAEVVGPDNVRTDDDARISKAAGRSYLDLLALRSGTVEAPDAVLVPGSSDDVRSLLAVCAERRIAVVPFGGGTSVVGGVAPLRGEFDTVVALDLQRLDQLLSVDDEAMTATFEPGVRGPAAEALLNARGLTLGHFPQSYEYASLGGYAATRSSGQASTGYGRFDELVVAMVVQTPAGELRLGRGAASAAGPDLRALLLGSEGAFGIITELTLRVRRVADAPHYEAFFFRAWRDGVAALRELEQQRLAPDVARLSDEDETRVQLALSGASRLQRVFLRGRRATCLSILGWDDTDAARRKRAVAVVRSHGGFSVGKSAAEKWKHGRYDGPYLRDDLLDAGVLVETLETSARWSSLASTHAAVRSALQSALPGAIVMCHVSHLYAHGASLYFTVIGRQAADPVAQWQQAKRAACDAIVSSGATITHHHAVGTDHRPWMTDEIGPLGVDVLRAVKAVLDPAGILNPGKLIP
ncbi:MAG: alkyldihydroxyacetonephosphate synthase [Actinomycetota bacterium]|jgi:alkyldihydroxyacetonephosphate synthase|nr:alkyldihydroxyacetonephosphate synthase [Actinomycetota bacterium]